jgi:hypothetical protein
MAHNEVESTFAFKVAMSSIQTILVTMFALLTQFFISTPGTHQVLLTLSGSSLCETKVNMCRIAGRSEKGWVAQHSHRT